MILFVSIIQCLSVLSHYVWLLWLIVSHLECVKRERERERERDRDRDRERERTDDKV